MRNRIALAALVALGLGGCQLGDMADPEAAIGSSGRAIIGGDPDGAEHASVCAMQILLPPDPDNPDLPRNERWCTCALIEAQTVLTAASCVYRNLDPEGEYPDADYLPDIDLRFGSSFSDGTPVAVTEGVVHRYYDPDVSSRYNLALLRLGSAPGVTPAVLNERPLTDDDVGTDLTLVGFGERAEEMGNFGARYRLTTPLTVVDDRFVFAGTETETTCDGDSGGPGFMDFGGGEVLATITVLQNECFPNAQRTRVDPFLETFIYPYIDRFSGPCPKDTVCDDQVECRSPDPDCEPCAWDGETCVEDCPTRDWDCELGSFTGEPCAIDGECEEQGYCIEARDDPRLTYCTRPCDPAAGSNSCPSEMECRDAGGGAGECTYLTPSPGSQGYPCNFESDCRSGICEETICVEECEPGADACPEGFNCLPSTVKDGADVCLGTVLSGGGGFCDASADPAGTRGGLAALLLAWLAAAALVLRRRRG